MNECAYVRMCFFLSIKIMAFFAANLLNCGPGWVKGSVLCTHSWESKLLIYTKLGNICNVETVCTKDCS